MGEVIPIEAAFSTDQHRADFARAAARGMTPREFRVWRANLRADYRAIRSPGRINATALSFALLFFLLDPDALLGVTMCNRPMTAEEQKHYSAHPMCQRRRKPGETIDDDEERARRRRVVGLMQGIHEDAR